ncbi:effector-associated constant component EACC1 [Streptomyces sp. NPDC001076]
MDSRLIVVGGSPDETVRLLTSLTEWLRHEEDLRGRTRLVHSKIPTGTMGGLPEALVVALSTGGAASVLARAVVEWVKQRKSDVTVKAVRPTGESFEFDLRRVADPESVITQLRTFLDAGQPVADHDETA